MNRYLKNLLPLAFAALTFSAYAEFEVSPSVKVAKDKRVELAQELPLNNQPQVQVNKKLVKATENRPKQDIYAGKSKSFRCWQFGELIVAETGYSQPTAAGKALLSKGGKQMTGFDFGETFCLYLGD